jgi:hypothetical protein
LKAARLACPVVPMYSILWRPPDDERPDSSETCRADTKLWNKIDYKNCASRWLLTRCNMMHSTHNVKFKQVATYTQFVKLNSAIRTKFVLRTNSLHSLAHCFCTGNNVYFSSFVLYLVRI